MIDQNTESKYGLNFARLLIEVELNANLLDNVIFRNERGSLVEQKVLYEWKPTLCKYSEKYGHDEVNCLKKAKKMWFRRRMTKHLLLRSK